MRVMRGIVAAAAIVLATTGVARGNDDGVTSYNDGENGAVSILDLGDMSGSSQFRLPGILVTCAYTTIGKPNTNKTELLVTATAMSPTGAPSVWCEVFNGSGGVAFGAALPGFVGAGSAEVTYGEFTICVQGAVRFADGSVTRTPRVCVPPVSPIR